jgi:protein-S-isoprenylcysteine O-methyltransferase Ste14
MAERIRKYGLGQLVLTCILTVLFFPALILGLAGSWRWTAGWIFAVWFDVMVLSITLCMYVRDPALLAERTQAPGSRNQKPWGKFLLTAIYVIAIAWLIVMPLDAERFGWSPPFPLWLKALGGLALMPALYFIYRATVDNAYLSTLVRIQNDRGQHVISTGVYGLVRHPLYFGCLLLMIGAPLLLGSVYGPTMTSAGLTLLVGRIIGEEAMLTSGLKGYETYKRKVIHRLIPFVW